MLLSSWYNPQDVTPIPFSDWLSVKGCWSPSEADNILFPCEVGAVGEIPGLASEIIIVSIPPPCPPLPSHVFISAATPGLQQLEDLHNVCSSAPRALLVIPLSCLPHPSALTQSRSTPSTLPFHFLALENSHHPHTAI